MRSINAYYNGDTFVPLEKPVIQPNQKVIITILDDFVGEQMKPKNVYEEFFGTLDNESFLEIENALLLFSRAKMIELFCLCNRFSG